MDAYEIPDRLRTQIQLRDAYSVFPYDTTRARACDLDHTNPWRQGGPPDQTRTSNLAALGRRPHRAKTFGAWQLKQPRSGVFDWTSPLGYRYRVDHQGTTWLDDPNRLNTPSRE